MSFNYVLENNINFFSELKNSLIEDDNSSMLDSSNNVCLITHQPLTTYSITLDCNHSFNYIPLYNDLVTYKQTYNALEYKRDQLSQNEIRCPYCRTKHTMVLPYYKHLKLPKIKGVNDPIAFQQSYINKQCEFIKINELFDPNLEIAEYNKPYFTCSNWKATKIAIYNQNDPLNYINYNDNNFYCSVHKKEVISKYKQLEKEQKKVEKELFALEAKYVLKKKRNKKS